VQINNQCLSLHIVYIGINSSDDDHMFNKSYIASLETLFIDHYEVL